jgi:hypothetical protein
MSFLSPVRRLSTAKRDVPDLFCLATVGFQTDASAGGSSIKSDIRLQNGQQLAVWEMNRTSIVGGGNIGTLAPRWSVADTGDFNRDGCADLLLQNGQQLAEWQLHGTTILPGSGNIANLLGAGWDHVHL